MYRRSLLLMLSVPAVMLAGAPAALAGEPTTITVETPPPPPVTVTVPGETPPAVTVPGEAPPVQTVTVSAPAPKSSGGGGGSTKSAASAKPVSAPVRSTPTVQAVRQTTPVATSPVGGVQAGAGGTAGVPDGSPWLALGLAGGSLLLLGSGGWMVARGRSHGS